MKVLIRLIKGFSTTGTKRVVQMTKKFFRKFLLRFLSKLIPTKQDIILFESYPELDGSPWMIYQEIKKRGWEKKYKLIWATDASFLAPENVVCIPFFGKMSLLQKIKKFYYIINAKTIIDSNRYVRKLSKKTFRLHTRHGGTLKKADCYSKLIGDVDYILSLSDEMAEIESQFVYKGTSVKRNHFLTMGYPNNDRLFFHDGSYKDVLFCELLKRNDYEHNKVIGWMPTFRKHKSNDRVDSLAEMPYGIPLLYKQDDFDKLNDLLQRNKILLVIKLHHAQLLDFPVIKCSNIVTIYQKAQDSPKIPMMNLLELFDALITDYSSIYHEYILLNRPIALSIDDIDSYSAGTGFSIDYFEWIKGVYLKNTTDLFHFIEDIANGVDSAKKEREAAMHRIHKYIDNKSTQRVVDFLIEKAML